MKNVELSCPLCGRSLGATRSEHHLIPKSVKKTDETILMHQLCHDQIHHFISEKEMGNYYNTVSKLLEHEDVRNFVRWVKNKHPDFYIMTRDTKSRNRKR